MRRQPESGRPPSASALSPARRPQTWIARFRCPIVGRGALQFCGLIANGGVSTRALRRGKIHVDGLALHRRRGGRFRLRRRRALSAEAVAGAAHLRSLARHDRRDRRPHLAPAGAGARDPGRVGLQLLFDAEIGDGDVRRPRHSAQSGARRIRAGNRAGAGEDERNAGRRPPHGVGREAMPSPASRSRSGSRSRT